MNYFQRAYALGVKHAESAFKPVAAPKPSSTVTKSVLPDNPVGMKPIKPASTPQIDIPKPPTALSGMPPQQPVMPQLSQLSQQHSATNALNSQMKMIDPLAKFSVDGDAIATDNGLTQHQPSTNEKMDVDRRVSQGFEALRTMKNTDFINAGNEAAFTPPGGGAL